MLRKWDIIRVFRPDLPRPHDKLCICICPKRHWYFYINSEPPLFKRARPVAIEIDNFQVACITHTSYIDTTAIIDDLPARELKEALSDEGRRPGSISPTLRKVIIETVCRHGVLNQAQQDAVCEGDEIKNGLPELP